MCMSHVCHMYVTRVSHVCHMYVTRVSHVCHMLFTYPPRHPPSYRSVLTGLFTPSAGTARVYDQDIRTHMDDIRNSLGLCPQHNILFDLLTVREHLLFYGMMRGLGYRHIADNVPGWVWPHNLSTPKAIQLNQDSHFQRKMTRTHNILRSRQMLYQLSYQVTSAGWIKSCTMSCI